MRRIYKIFSLFFYIVFVFTAYPQQYIVLDSSDNNVDSIYEARDYVRYLPGYHYKPPQNGSGLMIGRINENIVCNVDYTDINNVPDAFEPVNTNLPVGAIPGSYDVSNTGAVTYRIPIYTPQGVNNFQPSISIVYNSNSLYGIAGAGWNIAGISAITRSNKDYYHDGTNEEMVFHSGGKFTLDGNRLIIKYVDDDSIEYYLENENFSEVRYYKNDNYFRVRTIDGFTYEYGNTQDSKFMLGGNENKTLSWYLNKATDKFGNEIIYKYDNTGNEIVLQSIEYAGVNKINFYYDYRTADNLKGYLTGYPMEKRKLLRKIKVYTNDEVVREYDFKYTQSNNLITQLYEVMEKGRNGAQKNPLIFEYENAEYTATNTHLPDTTLIPGQADYIMGDFNGDGEKDIVAFYYHLALVPYGTYYEAYDTLRDYDSISLYLYNNGNYNYVSSMNVPPGNEVYLWGKQGLKPTPLFAVFKYNMQISASEGSYCLDLNNDGKDDLLLKIIENGQVKLIPYYSTGTGFEEGEVCLSFDKRFSNFDNDPNGFYHRIVTGDFNGDGKIDVLALLFGGGHLTGYAINTIGENNISINTLQGQTIAYSNTTYIAPVNFNTDGKTEILIAKPEVNTNNAYIMRFSDDLSPIISHLNNFPYNNSNDFFMTGDFNGDGITDLCRVSNFIDIAYGTGNGYTEPINITNGLSYDVTIYLHNTFIYDINKDGKSDIIRYGNNKIYIYYAKSDSTFIERHYNFNLGNNFTVIVNGSPYKYQDYRFVGMAEFDMDNQTSSFERLFFQRKQVGLKTHTIPIIKGNLPNLLKRVRDSYGNITEFKYDDLTNDNIYTRGTCASFPLVDYQGQAIVVDSVITDDGIGGKITTSYKYKGAKMHLQGKGFIGFTQIISESQDLNIKTIKSFGYDNYYYVVENFQQEVKTFDDIPISQTEKIYNLSHNLDIVETWSNGSFTHKRYKPKLMHSFTQNFLKGITTHSTYEYYNTIYSPLKKITTNINDIYTITEEYEYDNYHFVADVPALVKKYTKITTNQVSDPFTEVVNYTYNNGILSSEESKGITIHYENYDNFGNPRRIRKSASGVPDRYETFTYDNTGRFMISRTNQLGHTVHYEYDPLWGNVSKMTDINGKVTKYEYDNWGRVKKITYPTGVEKTFSLNWITTQDQTMPTALFYSLTQTTGQPYVKTYFDSFSRKLRSETESYGNKILADVRYDKFGHIIKKYDPYFDGNYSTADITVNEYDNFSRLAKTVYKGIETDFSYGIQNNLYVETTTYDATGTPRFYKSYYDPLGNVVKSQTSGGTVDFTYGSNGQVLRTTANGVTSTMQYHPVTALQTSLTDPNSGTTHYQYNGFGELIRQTDANNNVTETILDQYGRVDYIQTAEGITNTEYVENGNGLEQIKSVESPNGYKTQYTYDEYGRVTQKIETINGQNYIHRYQYDENGNLIKEIYPSGFGLRYIYNQQGELLAVRRTDNNHTVWYCDQYNEKGQPLTIYLGPNGSTLKTIYEYNDFGRIARIKTGYAFDMRYLWDNAKGNLLSRQDVIHNLNEQFEYDNMDRLTSWRVNSNQPYYSYYDNKGNITVKTNAGIYYYDPTKVHAVSRIQNPTGAISTLQQDITYTSFNKTRTITEGDYTLQIEYGPGNYRKKTVLTRNDTIVYTRIFAGNYEKEISEDGTVKEYHYISGPSGLIAVYIITNGMGHLYYVATDHLGSICQLIEPDGTVVEETNYGPWGRVRDPHTWQYDDNTHLTRIPRGYTGHEMLWHFALINMNGRVYDPVLGRFLAPDNYVQNPNNPQNYNRYTYALNNPLKYVDPSGQSFISFLNKTLTAIFLPFRMVTGAVNYVTQHINGNSNYKFNHNYVMTGKSYNNSANSPYLIRGPHGYPIGETGELDPVQYGFRQGKFTDAAGDEWSVGPDGYQRNLPEGYKLIPIYGSAYAGAGPYLSYKGRYVKGYILRKSAVDIDKSEKLTLPETNTMATYMGYVIQGKLWLIKQGLKGSSNWGKTVNTYMKVWKGMGNFLGLYSAFVYSFDAYNAYSKGDKLHTLSNSLMSFYTIVATKGGYAGLLFSMPFFVIDQTIGMDNFLKYNFEYGIKQAEMIQNGNLWITLWRPGQGLR